MNVTCEFKGFFNALLAAPDEGVVILRATGSHLSISDGGSRSVPATAVVAVVAEPGVFNADVRRLREALRTLDRDSMITFATEEDDLLRVLDVSGNQVRIVATPATPVPSSPGAATQGEIQRPAPAPSASPRTEPSSPGSDYRQPRPPSRVVNPSGVTWAYGWSGAVAGTAIIASVLSVIGGIVLGIVLSKSTTTDSFGLPRTAHHGGVVVYWIVAGILSAALWMALAVGVELLADIGKSLRDMRLKT